MNQKIEYESYLEEVQGLFPMPRIMAEVLRKVREEDATMDDLSDLLMSDASLVASIVKLSNSSYFGYAEKCESLIDAMQRIGLREIARLVGICTVNELYQAELIHYRVPPEVFWESGVSAAILMESLSGPVGLDSQLAYLTGLMRESGMLVINYALCKEQRGFVWDGTRSVHLWERDVFEHDHMEVGEKLLRSWGFSEDICVAVSKQWGRSDTEEGLTGLLELVVRVMAHCGCDFCFGVRDFSEFEPRLAALGLDEQMLRDSLAASAESFKRLRAGVLELG